MKCFTLKHCLSILFELLILEIKKRMNELFCTTSCEVDWTCVVIFNVFLFHASSYFQRVAVTSVTWQIPHLGMNLLLLMGILL